MNRLFFVVILTLTVIFIVILTLAFAYQGAIGEARGHPNMWCYNDWKCKVPPDTAPDGGATQLTRFRARHGDDAANGATGNCGGVGGTDCVPGQEYDAKTYLIDPTKDCNSKPMPSGPVMVDPISGCQCAPGTSGCVGINPACATLTRVKPDGTLEQIFTYDCLGVGEPSAYDILNKYAYGSGPQQS